MDEIAGDRGNALEDVVERSTRDRILDVALDLFSTKGYSDTSLREIAAELGFSKAALYYHFPGKQDILLALHLRVHGLTAEVAPYLGDTADPGAWSRFMDALLRIALRNRKLVALHFRDQDVIAALHTGAMQKHMDDDNGFEQMLFGLVAPGAASTETRVRRMASLGTVVAAFLGSGILADVSDDDLERILREVAGDILPD